MQEFERLNRVHKVLSQILALKVCISSQKPRAKDFIRVFIMTAAMLVFSFCEAFPF